MAVRRKRTGLGKPWDPNKLKRLHRKQCATCNHPWSLHMGKRCTVPWCHCGGFKKIEGDVLV